MTEEQQKFEMEQAEMLMVGINKKAGYIVETKKGLIGRTYHHENMVNGKTRVYTDKGNLLCDPQTLTIKGFAD